MAEVQVKVSRNPDSDTFIVENLTITDSDSVEYLESLEEDKRVQAVQTAVRFGLLALRDFGTVSKVDWVDKRFDEFSRVIEDSLEQYLGEHGELERAFSDADGPIRNLLDPTHESSPIFELRRGLKEDIQSLRDVVVGEAAREEEAKAGTRKGFRFEDELLEYLEPLCSDMGDTVEKTGKKKSAGRKVGDLLIKVNEDYLSDPLSIVIEAKSGSVSVHGKKGLLVQLNQAIELRKAQFAIGVTKHSEKLRGIKGPFGHFAPDKVICIFEPDGTAFQLAYKFARTQALLRFLGMPVLDSATCAGVSSKMATIKKKLDTLSTAKRHLTNINNSSKEIREIINKMKREINDVLADIETMVRSVPGSESKSNKRGK